MRIRNRLLIVALCCAALACIAGPAVRLLFVLPLLLFGPGYLFERAWAAFEEFSLALRLALWLGLSISLVALIYEWATALGLSLTAPALDVLAASCGVGVVWRFLRGPTTDDPFDTAQGRRRPTTPSTRLRAGDDRQQTRQRDEETTSLGGVHSPDRLLPQSHPLSSGRWSVVGGLWSFALLVVLALTFWTRFSQIE